jgi:hypothetical protein
MERIFDTVRAVTASVSKVPASTDPASLTGAELSTLVRELGLLRQEAERVLAWSAAEVNRRSRVQFGGAGLAKAAGFVNSEAFIAVLTGTSKAEARKIDRLGRSLMQATDPASPGSDVAHGDARPWFAVVTELMVAGRISPDRCEALRAGLGDPNNTVTPDALADAAARLLDLLHPDDTPESVFRDARQTRALLDRAGVAENESSLQARQEAKVWTSRDGMVHLRADFAPEDGTWVKNTLDLILGPRIGGPRFAGPTTNTANSNTAGPAPSDSVTDETQIDEATHLAATAMTDDPRSTEQIRASALLSLLKAGAEVDDNAILARKRPTVQIIITATELTQPNNDGVAFIEGTRYPVTKRTIDRLICDTGYTPLITHPATGSPLDLGRDVRLFTPTQRTTLATLQGGCVWNGCDKPPTMCETHHITPWAQHGKTNIHDGVLLCRYHHHQLHNHNWHITRTTTTPNQHDLSEKPAPHDQLAPHTRPGTPGQPEPRYEHSYWLVPPAQSRSRTDTHPTQVPANSTPTRPRAGST